MSRSRTQTIATSVHIALLSATLITSPVLADDPVNLLQNGGFESGLLDWQTDQAVTRAADPDPHGGSAYLYGGYDVETSYTSQTVDLIAAGYSPLELDQGGYTVRYGGWQATGAAEQQDTGLVSLQFLDGSQGLIATDDLGSFFSYGPWEERQGVLLVPAGTRYITYGFQALRIEERGGELPPPPNSDNNGSLDDAFLYLDPVVPPYIVGIETSIQFSGIKQYVIDVTFSEAIDPATFTLDDVLLDGPSGPVAPVSLSHLAGETYRIVAATTIEAGSYDLEIGPDIASSLTGSILDQDGDGTPGELEDSYSTQIDSGPWNTLTLTADTTLAEGSALYDDVNLIVDGATITIDGSHSFDSLTLINGAMATHTVGLAAGSQITASQVTVDGTSKIDVSYRGDTSSLRYSGASHGGLGGEYPGYPVSPVYGDPLAPVALGAGTDNRWGGGALKLDVDQLQLDGIIAADGHNSGNYYVGGASGGSLWLDLGVLTGSGSIRANGGSSTQGSNGVGGGGGRIAIYYTDASGFDLTTQVQNLGGLGSNSSRPDGGAGTLYLEDKVSGNRSLQVDNGDRANSPAKTELADLSVDLLQLNNAHMVLTGNGVIDRVEGVQGTLEVTGSLDATVTEVVLSGDLLLITPSVTTGTSGSVYDGLDLVVDGARAEFNGIHSFDSLTLINGAMATHTVGLAAGSQITASQVTVDGTSKIDVSYRGDTSSLRYSGASHGGLGGEYPGYPVSPVYGDPLAPVALGAGTDNRWGGGALKLDVDQLQLDGIIAADGHNSGNYYVGGASGGSLWLDLGVLTGSGSIRANGGSSTQGSNGVGGGGGRIAIYYTDAGGFDLTTQVQNLGGLGSNSSRPDGGAGTLYLEDKVSGNRSLRVDNGDRANSPAKTELADLSVDLLQLNNAHMVLTGNGVIDRVEGVQGTLAVTGSLAATVTEVVLSGDLLLITPSVTTGTSGSVYDGLDLVVDGARAEFNGIHSFDSLTLINGAMATHTVGLAAGSQITASQVTVDGTSKIDVSYRGDTSSLRYSGASHGGLGGEYPGYPVSPVYGDPLAPVALGAGTDNRWGGGALKLDVDQLQLGGIIAADGHNSGNYYVGGASGGSLWLDLGVLTGSGSIRANGGSSTQGSNGVGGGGGRIAIYYTDASGFDLTTQVQNLGGLGSGSSRPDGQPGSIHLEDKQGPVKVLSSSPEGVHPDPIAGIALRFNLAVNPASFTLADVLINGPSGAITPSGITQAGAIDFTIDFNPPLDEEGEYTLAVGPGLSTLTGNGMDQDGDGTINEAGEDVYHASITLDRSGPPKPVIDTYLPLPAVNPVTVAGVLISGSRSEPSSIWFGETQAVPLDEGDWSHLLSLPQGISEHSIVAKDAAGNPSEALVIQFDVDSIAPAVTQIDPADGSYLNSVPAGLSLTFVETGSGVDIENSTLYLSRGGNPLEGSWNIQGSELIFTPSVVFTEGIYQLGGRVLDQGGLDSGDIAAIFVIDQTPPAPPAVDALPATTTINQQLVSGDKEAQSAIWFDGQQVVDHSVGSRWSHTVSLVEGENALAFSARDRAGNESLPTNVGIVFDNSAPGAVTPVASNNGNGTHITLDWQDYDEVANGNDIDSYHIYSSTADFSDTGAAALVATVSGGQKQLEIGELNRSTTYYLAVVAEDTMGNAITAVTPVVITTQDQQAPAEVSAVQVTSQADRLSIAWTAPADSDLAGFRLYFDNDSGTDLTAATLTHEVTGLAAASGYPIRIATRDNDSNESPGVDLTGVTLLPNPGGLAAEALDSQVALSWNGAAPAEYVKQYAIYVQESAFNSISAIEPRLMVDYSVTQAQVAGLSNGVTYHFAVTTINLSGGQTAAVTSVSATPAPDSAGPQIGTVTFDGTALANGATVTRSGVLAVTASDPSGVGRVEFRLGGETFASDIDPGDGYSAHWDLYDIGDGAHTLTIAAYDTLENEATLDLALTVDLEAPAAPAITAPADGERTNQPQIQVTGTAEPNSDVLLYLGAVQVAGPLSVNGAGTFDAQVTLGEGDNVISATAGNRGGESPHSSAVTVTLDSSVPNAPDGLAADARSNGQILLSWNLSSDPRVVSYDLYRSTQPFDALGQAVQANNHPIVEGRYTDLPSADGNYIYRLVARNELGTPSALSVPVEAVSDSQLPRALAIDYTPTGAFDPDSGRMATGAVSLTLEVDEPLLTTPFLSIAPAGGVPMSVQLQAVDETHYQGSFDITETTPSGTAYAIFSARDLVGNRGDEILEGATLEIDTDGPEAIRLTLAPASPISTDQANPTQVAVEIELDQAVKAGTSPMLSYLLSGAGRQSTAIDGLVPLSDTVWRGSLVLPADAGLASAENLQFTLQALDDLDNPGTRIRVDNLFQVYQGDLPPLAIPNNLSAQASPGGEVALTWDGVPDAAEYQLYRQAPGEPTLTALQRVSASGYQDATPEDGDYLYSVASVRQANGDEALSGQSPAVGVTADASEPGPPQGLTLELMGAGIKALWQPPVGLAESVSYRLYRDSGTTLDDVDGLTPVQADIVADAQGQLGFIDLHPDQDEAVYAVTAVDAAGNESLPSAAVYLNIDLLPVSDLVVRQVDFSRPDIQWSHSGGNIAGYNLYVDGSSEPLNMGLILGNEYSDISYTEGSRRYRVAAEDTAGATSIERSVTLPQVEASLTEESSLRRGIMNRLSYRVVNTGAEALNGIQLKISLEGQDYLSEPFGLASQAEHTASVIVGGRQDLPDLVNLARTIQVTADTGERAERIRNQAFSVGDDTLLLRVESQELVRGTQGSARFLLENSSDVETEILLSQAGNQASDEIRLLLQDPDGNVLAVSPVQQSVGDGVVTLTDGRAVARIAPGAVFTSDWSEIDIPAGAPDQVEVVLEIDRFRYHLGQSDAVDIAGMRSGVAASLADTEYTATVDDISPASSFGDQPVVISGRAVDRSSGEPSPGMPIKVIVAVNGYERVAEAYADAQGEYAFTYTPLPGESGVYTVSAIHPDLLARPGQGQFTIQRIVVAPTILDYRLPRNYQQTLSVIRATAGAGTSATNLHLIYESADQSGGVLPQGIDVTLGDPVDLTPGASAVLPVTISSDNTANAQESLVLRIASDENPDLGTVTLNLQLAEALPALGFSPNFVETGVAHDDTVTETVTFTNVGLADLTDMQLSITETDGSPAPAWVRLLSTADQGDLAVGEKREIRLAATPSATVAEGVYSLRLLVESGNMGTTHVNLYVAVTQSGVGSILFKASDIYTATLDQEGQPIPGLANTRIRVQNEVVINIEETLITDQHGEALFSDLAAGNYRFRASASNHQDLSGRFTVKPGVTGTQEIFLDYNLVSVEWSVTEITIEDKYEITLQAIFETDVPAAVVVIEPASVTLPEMAPGDLFYGELRITNHGLVRADDLVFTLPGSDAYFRYEFPQAFPESLEAKESRLIPYRITALAPLDPDGSGSGGGCRIYQKELKGNYGYICANGTTTQGTCGTRYVTQVEGSCGTSGSGGGGGDSPVHWYGDSGGSGGSVSGGNDYSPIKSAKCIPTPACPTCQCNENPDGQGPGHD